MLKIVWLDGNPYIVVEDKNGDLFIASARKVSTEGSSLTEKQIDKIYKGYHDA